MLMDAIQSSSVNNIPFYIETYNKIFLNNITTKNGRRGKKIDDVHLNRIFFSCYYLFFQYDIRIYDFGYWYARTSSTSCVKFFLNKKMRISSKKIDYYLCIFMHFHRSFDDIIVVFMYKSEWFGCRSSDRQMDNKNVEKNNQNNQRKQENYSLV